MQTAPAVLAAVITASIASVTLAGGTTGALYLLGAEGLTPSGVSANGSVVVGYNPSQFWYWTSDQGIIGIGGISPSSGGAGSADVSSNGTRIGYTVLNPANGKTEAAFYDIATSTSTLAGNFGFSCDVSATSCWGMSGDGNTIVGLGWHNLCAARGFKSSAAGGLVDLGTLVPGSPSRANACSSDASVIAGWQDSQQGARQATYWKNGQQKLIFGPNGQTLGEAGVVSSDGEWILGLGASTNNFLGWRWSETTGYVALPASPIAGFRAFPTGISDDHSRILLFYRTQFPPATAGEGYMIVDGVLKSLEVLAAENGIVVPAGVRMSLPLAISGDGYTVVGSCRSPAGVQGFILDLPRPAPCVADLNGDGTVSSQDVAFLLSAWGGSGSADLDGDGVVASSDVAVLLSSWGACP